MRNWIKLVSRGFDRRGHRTAVAHLNGDPRWSALRPATLRSVRRAAPEVLIYVPYSGLTSKALLRHLALKRAARARTDVFVTLQANADVRTLPSRLSPMVGAFASPRLRDAHSAAGQMTCVFPPAVDAARFNLPDTPRRELRERLGLTSGRPMLLHVGHLTRARGLEPLARLAAGETATVVIIASTSTEPDAKVVRMLQKSGVIIKHEFVPDIQAWYQAADVYVFPVSDLQGSIEVPLTVLEAMACGVPVATTPFGGLPGFFADSPSLRFGAPERLPTTAQELIGVDGTPNRSQVDGMTQEALMEAFEQAIEAASA